MSPRSEHRQAGFTLLEILISISLFLMLLATIAVALDSNRSSYLRGEAKMDVQQSGRLALSSMATQIRMAGYFPENFGSPAASPALDNAVQIATDSALAVHGDLDGSGTSAVYLYCREGSTLRRGRAPEGDSSAYWCPAAEVLAENVTSLRFDYFGEDNLPIPASPTVPFSLDSQAAGSVPDMTILTQRAAVRKVVISMTITGAVGMQGDQVYRLGSEVKLRNVR